MTELTSAVELESLYLPPFRSQVMPIPTLKRFPPEHGFRGHPNFRNAHRVLLANPFKSEAKYFDTRDFKPGQISWNIEAASSNRSSVSATADSLRQYWDNGPSGEEVLKVLRDIPETDAETIVNRMLLKQYKMLPAATRRELEQDATVLLDFYEDPF
ncbi:MAG: hypothetical protein RBG13Loki_3958 [Promethearchaeota archaeon CR_4]|nr:MAG: hypothetical protein RBG13Loki_3958 [Candidatus Lokiarchaeota archaeon CR_4]